MLHHLIILWDRHFNCGLVLSTWKGKNWDKTSLGEKPSIETLRNNDNNTNSIRRGEIYIKVWRIIDLNNKQDHKSFFTEPYLATMKYNSYYHRCYATRLDITRCSKGRYDSNRYCLDSLALQAYKNTKTTLIISFKAIFKRAFENDSNSKKYYCKYLIKLHDPSGSSW